MYGLRNICTQLNAGQLRRLQRNRNVISVVPDRRVNAIARGGKKKPKPPAGQVASAGAQRIGAVGLLYTGLGVGVAIADTGLDSSHQDLNVSPTGFTGCFRHQLWEPTPLWPDSCRHGQTGRRSLVMIQKPAAK